LTLFKYYSLQAHSRIITYMDSEMLGYIIQYTHTYNIDVKPIA